MGRLHDNSGGATLQRTARTNLVAWHQNSSPSSGALPASPIHWEDSSLGSYSKLYRHRSLRLDATILVPITQLPANAYSCNPHSSSLLRPPISSLIVAHATRLHHQHPTFSLHHLRHDVHEHWINYSSSTSVSANDNVQFLRAR